MRSFHTSLSFVLSLLLSKAYTYPQGGNSPNAGTLPYETFLCDDMQTAQLSNLFRKTYREIARTIIPDSMSGPSSKPLRTFFSSNDEKTIGLVFQDIARGNTKRSIDGSKIKPPRLVCEEATWEDCKHRSPSYAEASRLGFNTIHICPQFFQNIWPETPQRAECPRITEDKKEFITSIGGRVFTTHNQMSNILHSMGLFYGAEKEKEDVTLINEMIKLSPELQLQNPESWSMYAACKSLGPW